MKHNKINFKGSKFEKGYGYSKFVKLKLKDKTSTPILSGIANTFGVNYKDRNKKNIFCEVKESNNGLDFYSKCNLKNSNSWILAASTIRIGKSIWETDPKFTGFDLGKVKDYKKLMTDINFVAKVRKGFGDFSYDIWLTKDRSFGKAKKDTIEIMIILYKNFDNFLGKIIQETKDFEIRYELKKNKSGGFDNGHTFAFVLKNKKIRKFDILQLIDYCSKKLKKDLNNHYLRSIDVINEISYNTDMKVILKELNFDFNKT
jgi:hypothetical protein